jgi:hypothetical protein
MKIQNPSNDNKPVILVIESLNKLRTELKLVQYPKTTNRVRQDNYALEANQFSSDLCMDFDNLLDARVNLDSEIDCFKKKVGLETAIPQIGWAHRLLGWLHRTKKIPAEELRLTDLVRFAPKKMALRQAKSFDDTRLIEQATVQAAEDTQKILKAALKWLRKERLIHPSTEKGIVEVFLVIAKFLYCEETDSLTAENYGDIPVIIMLRQELKEAKQRAENAPPAADESLKWLNWPEFLACVHHLEAECQPVYSYGVMRSPTAIARSIQRYLLFAFLAYIPPNRQRILRELESGKTLVRGTLSPDEIFEAEEDGKWYIHLMKGDYKTGKTYGEQWLMVPDVLYPYLEAWLNQWRAEFSPKHNYVFTKENGKPYDKPSDLSSIIRRTTHRLTGKLTTSHLIRHMLITYMKRNGASDEVMQSLAEAMHHSTKTQSQIYDRRHKFEKVAVAQEVVMKLAMGESVSQLSGGRSLTVEEIAHQILQLPSGDRQRLLSIFNQS